MRANWTPYRVDGEVGRFSFPTCRLEQEGEVVFDSGRELFPALSGEQWYLTRGFKEIAMFYGAVKRPCRETTGVINRMRHVTEATPMRSLRAQSERAGATLQAHLAQKSEAILRAHGVSRDEEAGVTEPRSGLQPSAQKAEVAVAAARAACAEETEVCAEMMANPAPYEEPSQSVNLAVDDVGVKRQKARRRRGGQAESELAEREQESQKKKSVQTMVAHVETEAGSDVLSGLGVVAVLHQVPAFLLANGLKERSLVVLVDGQRSRHTAWANVLRCWRSWRVILDWYHLEKRCRENLSLALKGRAIRHQVLEK